MVKEKIKIKNLKNRILYIVQLPPPVHGVSMMNYYVVSDKYNPVINYKHKKIIRLKFSNSIEDLKKITFSKIFISIKVFFTLAWHLYSFKPQIVYFTVYPCGKAFFLRDLFYLILIKLFPAKIILHIHNFGIAKGSRNMVKRFIYNWVFRNVTLIFLSKKQRNIEINRLKLENTNTYILKNGIPKIDINKYISKMERKSYNLLFFSNLFYEKGIFFLLKTFANYTEKHDNIKLIIAGQDFDNNLKKITKYIIEWRLEESIIIKTNIFGNEKWQLYGNSDIFIFPSFFQETSSLVILEAMQFGLPIIASNIGAIPELLAYGKCGLLFNPNDLDSLQTALDKYITNPEYMIEMGKNARQYFLENYTLKQFKNSLYSIFKEVHDE